MTFRYMESVWSPRVERLAEHYDYIGQELPPTRLWTSKDEDFVAKTIECRTFLFANNAIGSKSGYHLNLLSAGHEGLPETSLLVCELPATRDDDTEESAGGIIAAVLIVREMASYRLAGGVAPAYRKRGHMGAMLACLSASIGRDSYGSMSLTSWTSRANVTGMNTLLSSGFLPAQTTSGGICWKADLSSMFSQDIDTGSSEGGIPCSGS